VCAHIQAHTRTHTHTPIDTHRRTHTYLLTHTHAHTYRLTLFSTFHPLPAAAKLVAAPVLVRDRTSERASERAREREREREMCVRARVCVCMRIRA